MDKMKMETPDLTTQNIEKIEALFPSCITEIKGENREIKKGINFKLLKQLLSPDLIDGNESFEFTWVGKRDSIIEANESIRKTLRPCKDQSVKWDSTKNLYIEGDNLDVLKLLQESYLEKIKLIYIDPPYNTGSDKFPYSDNYRMGKDEYNEKIGLYDDDQNRLFKENNVNNPRFHSVWCSMLYSRLLVAQNLLAKDGVIFISIDDNEVDTMIKIAKEVFGEDNFINLLTIKTKVAGVSGSSEGKSFKDATEFIGVFCKDKTKFKLNPVYIKTKLFNRIKAYEAEGKSWKYTSILTKLEDKTLIKEDKDRGFKYYGYKTVETMSIVAYAKKMKMTEEDVYNHYANRIFQTTNAQSSVRKNLMQEMKDYDYPMIGLEYVPIKGKNEGKLIELLYKGDQRRLMMFLSDSVEKQNGEYVYLDKITTLWDDIDYNNLSKEGDISFPNGKKPIKLLQRIIDLATTDDSIVLDFFSGSASTAHAVMQTNFEQNKHLKYIMVQFPEKCEENSDLHKMGFDTICDAGKARIRQSANQLHAANPSVTFDDGFRVFKVDDTNMKDVYYSADEYNQGMLAGLESNIKEDRTDLDLLFGCVLEWGLPLSWQNASEEIEGCTVYTYNDGDVMHDRDALIACFNQNIPESVIKTIAKREPLRVVFRDSSFASSPDKINVEEIFKMISPDTNVKVI